MEISSLRERLFALQDAKYADFQRKLIPTVRPDAIIGVRTPALRAMAKELYRKDATPFLMDVPHHYFEENQLHAFVISLLPDFPSAAEAVSRFLPFVDNWATCDQLSPKAFAKHPRELLPILENWLGDGHEYAVRFAMGMLMQHFLEAEFRSEYLDWVGDVEREEYYIRMMQAWYFATALAKQWDAAEPYMHRGRLPEWVRRKAIQKAIESFRIPADRKAHLRALR